MFGASLIAISYGLARFAFGLFLPPIFGILVDLLSPFYPRYLDPDSDEENRGLQAAYDHQLRDEG